MQTEYAGATSGKSKGIIEKKMIHDENKSVSLKDFQNRISKIQTCPIMRAEPVVTSLGAKAK